MEGCALVLVVVVAIAAISSVAQQRAREKARERARDAYHNALHRLKRDPTNPDLRGETLSLGRAYANLMRDRRGVALFDEVALSNDINAACAAAATSRPQREASAIFAGMPSIESRLTNLSDLRAAGLVDESEFAARRQEILREI